MSSPFFAEMVVGVYTHRVERGGPPRYVSSAPPPAALAPRVPREPKTARLLRRRGDCLSTLAVKADDALDGSVDENMFAAESFTFARHGNGGVPTTTTGSTGTVPDADTVSSLSGSLSMPSNKKRPPTLPASMALALFHFILARRRDEVQSLLAIFLLTL